MVSREGLTKAARVHVRGVLLAQCCYHGVPHPLSHILPGPAVTPKENQRVPLRWQGRLVSVHTAHHVKQLLRARIGRDDDVS